MGDGSVGVALEEGFDRALSLRRHPSRPIGSDLRKLYEVLHPQPVVVPARTFWGGPIHVVLPELVACELHRYGVIEPGLTKMFIDLVEPGMTVFDVGAHYGYYSLLAARRGARVHAFEPATSTLSLLTRNVASTATVVAKGVWSSTGTLRFQDFGDAHSAVNTFLEPKDPDLAGPGRTYPVEVTSLDDYVGATGAAPQLVKIDAEGAEVEVLRGAADTIRRQRPIVAVEVGDTGGTTGSRALLEHALTLGYEAFEMTLSGRQRHELRDVYAYGNILLLPRRRTRTSRIG